jgi:hypothetical protein
MSKSLLAAYESLVLRRPFLSLALVALLVVAAASQLDKIKLDASADSLLLQGDPALDFFREVSSEYSSEDFLLSLFAALAAAGRRVAPVAWRVIRDHGLGRAIAGESAGISGRYHLRYPAAVLADTRS